MVAAQRALTVSGVSGVAASFTLTTAVYQGGDAASQAHWWMELPPCSLTRIGSSVGKDLPLPMATPLTSTRRTPEGHRCPRCGVVDTPKLVVRGPGLSASDRMSGVTYQCRRCGSEWSVATEESRRAS